jgi:hypothetical protein
MGGKYLSKDPVFFAERIRGLGWNFSTYLICPKQNGQSASPLVAFPFEPPHQHIHSIRHPFFLHPDSGRPIDEWDWWEEEKEEEDDGDKERGEYPQRRGKMELRELRRGAPKGRRKEEGDVMIWKG